MKKLFLALFLVSCSQSQQVEKNIYQPKVLILNPHTVIQTKEGIYTTHDKEEIWHSQETIDKLEKQLSQF